MVSWVYSIAYCLCDLIASPHSGDDVYTWGWGGANGTFFEDGHSSGGQLVSCSHSHLQLVN
jgi:hypothetical protein